MYQEQQNLGMLVLIGETMSFCLISARCGWVYLCTSPQQTPPPATSTSRQQRRSQHPQQQRRRRVGGSSSRRQPSEPGEGVRWRRMVVGILCVACLSRAVATGLTLARLKWLPYLAVPDVAYLATYGVLCFFLAQIVASTTMGRGFVRSYRYQMVAMSALVVVLLLSLVVCTLRWRAGEDSKTSMVLRTGLFYELGITYILLWLAFSYYATRVCSTAWSLSKGVFYRMLLLSSVCGIALLSKGCLFVAAGCRSWRLSPLYKDTPNSFELEAVLALQELLPSLAILVLTERRALGSSPIRQTRPQLLISTTADDSSGSSPFQSSSTLVLSDAVSPGGVLASFRDTYGATTTTAAAAAGRYDPV